MKITPESKMRIVAAMMVGVRKTVSDQLVPQLTRIDWDELSPTSTLKINLTVNLSWTGTEIIDMAKGIQKK